MSKFSGKCDLCDMVEAIHCNSVDEIQEFIDNTQFYMWVNDRRVKINISSRKDLALYYPYLVSMSCHSDNKHTIVLSNDSFIDQEEADRLNFILNAAKQYYKKCKRDKKPFVEDECKKAIAFFSPTKYETELIKRVKKDGKKANIEGVHTYIHEYYRTKWYEALIELGWDEATAFDWVYKELFSDEKIRNERLKWEEKQ